MTTVVTFVLLGLLLAAAALPMAAFARAVFLPPSVSRRDSGPKTSQPAPSLVGAVVVAIEDMVMRGLKLPREDMRASRYARVIVTVGAVSAVVVYAVQRLQAFLPLNPAGFAGVKPAVAVNTAVSFATNTNWQAYSGEQSLSHFTQMVALGSQNFLSAAAGVAVVLALARAFVRSPESHPDGGVGNAYADLVRATIFLLPPSLVLAFMLVATGVPQTFVGALDAVGLDGAIHQLPLGPVASQVAIKQLGTNGGGYFGVNSAHPFENPTPMSGLLELLAILVIPVAMCLLWGSLTRRPAHGRALLLTMTLLFVPALAAVAVAESAPLIVDVDGDGVSDVDGADGNMEGKEQRFGVAQSAAWAAATTAASNGSVNAMHDSFTPFGGLVTLVLMLLGEVVFGGVGAGLYGMILFAIVAMFIAGQMVGRSPEFLGKSLGAFEMQMAALGLIVPSAMVLVGVAIATAVPAAATMANPGAHGFSEVLYAFASAANNNGSAFAGLAADGVFYAPVLALVMWLGRFAVILAVLGIAGSVVKKRINAQTAASMPAEGLTFVVLLAGTVVLVGALTFVPALTLGPVADHLDLSAIVRAGNGATP